METLALTHVYLACEGEEFSPCPATAQSASGIHHAARMGTVAGSAALLAIANLAPASEAIVKRGDTCPAVREIQQALVNQGRSVGSIDGVYGAKTQYAVKRFQELNNLPVDTVVGPGTATALGLDGNNAVYAVGNTCTGNTGGGSTPVANTVKVMTNGSLLNVREAPNLSAKVVGQLAKGSILPTSGNTENGWVELARGGWVSSSWVRASALPNSGGGGGSAPSNLMTVSTNRSLLNVREQPNTSARIVAQLAKGSKLPTTGNTSDGWIELVGGGWVASQWMK